MKYVWSKISVIFLIFLLSSDNNAQSPQNEQSESSTIISKKNYSSDIEVKNDNPTSSSLTNHLNSFTTCSFNPLLVAVLMVKNEAPVIRETLEPLVASGIDSFFIFDTGSTDDTIQVTKKFFADKDIKNAFIEQEPFVDFSTSRNRALDLAEKKFPNAAFMLMLDAEWHLCNGNALLKFCESHIYDPLKPHSYLISIVSDSLCFYIQRLIRCTSGIRFEGLVHETLSEATYAKVPETIFFKLACTHFGIEKSINRMKTFDVPALSKKHQENPHDSRTTFYLAQTYECLSDWTNAYKFYKRRTELKGWDEENFMAYYKLGHVTEHLTEIDSFYGWPMALHYYLTAYTMRPHRAEPLVKIANYYLRQDNFPLCFLFARRAAELPFPKDDVLFIEKDVYDYQRYDILGRCAWYIGEFEIGEKAVRKALEGKPNEPHLQRNLTFYTDRHKPVRIGKFHITK